MICSRARHGGFPAIGDIGDWTGCPEGHARRVQLGWIHRPRDASAGHPVNGTKALKFGVLNGTKHGMTGR